MKSWPGMKARFCRQVCGDIMSMEDLRRSMDFSTNSIRLEGFVKDFFESMAMMWSGALEKELTAEDIATLLACPFACGVLKEYSVKMGLEPTGIRIEVDARELKDN